MGRDVKGVELEAGIIKASAPVLNALGMEVRVRVI